MSSAEIGTIRQDKVADVSLLLGDVTDVAVVARLLDVLHGQRRSALGIATARVQGGTKQPANVDAVVGVEAAVFGVDQGLL